MLLPLRDWSQRDALRIARWLAAGARRRRAGSARSRTPQRRQKACQSESEQTPCLVSQAGSSSTARASVALISLSRCKNSSRRSSAEVIAKHCARRLIKSSRESSGSATARESRGAAAAEKREVASAEFLPASWRAAPGASGAGVSGPFCQSRPTKRPSPKSASAPMSWSHWGICIGRHAWQRRRPGAGRESGA